MLEILKGTPFWVYFLLFILIYKGIKALKPNIMKLKKLLIMPVVFLIMTLHKINTPYYYILFLLCGLIIGWLLYKNIKIRADKTNHLIALPGSSLPLILILIAFSKGYYFGYESSVHPEYLTQHWFILLSLITSGFFSGIFIGRAAVFLFKYKNAKHEELLTIAKETDS